MQTPLVESVAALNGRWLLHATTFPFLSDPRRTRVELRYFFDPRAPRRIRQETSWSAGGRTKVLAGTARVDDDGSLVWRGHGLFVLLSSQWAYSVSSDGDLALVNFAPTLLSVAGFHVLARRDVSVSTVRARLDVESRPLDLPRSELTSLRWRSAD